VSHRVAIPLFLAFFLTAPVPEHLRASHQGSVFASALPVAFAQGSYDAWRDRMREARAELAKLKDQRQKTQEEYENILRQRNLRAFQVDPQKLDTLTAKMTELDRLIAEKETQISTTIPNEARRAGVPPSVLSQ